MELVAIASATLAAVIGFGIAILAQAGKLGSIDDGIKRLNRIVDDFLISLTRGSTPSDFEQRLKAIESYVEQLKPKENPLSTTEIERFKTYTEDIGRGMSLSYEEYSDYRRLSERIKRELPKRQRTDFELLLAGLLGFAAGMALAELIRSLRQS